MNYLVVLLMVCLSFANGLFADDILDDLDVDVSVTSDDRSASATFWDKHGSATVGGFYFFAGDSGKRLAFLSAGFNYEWQRFKLNLEGSALSSVTELKVTEDRTDQNRESFKITRDKLRLISAYVDISLLDNLSLAVGRQSILWGQFDIFSPVDFAMPMDFDFAGQSIGKLGNRLPQDTAKLSWFPIESLELQAYYFPRLENLFEDFDELEVRSPSDESQKAVRVMYYSDFATVGVTYYDGFNHFDPADKSQLSDNGRDRINETLEINKNQMIGIELSKPIGRYTIKAEVAKHTGFQELERPNSDVVGFADYVNWVQNQNNNNLFFEYDIYYTAIGVDANLDRWKYSLSLINFTESFSSAQQDGIDLQDRNSRFNDEDDFGTTFPTLYIQYFLQDERRSHIGLAAGMLSGFMGASLYYQHEIREAFNVFAGFEFGQYWGDQNSTDEDNIEVEESLSGFKLGMSYQF